VRHPFVARTVIRLVPDVEEQSNAKEELSFSDKNKGAMKKALWLKYCLEIGWSKEQLKR